jgi:hypothetical protein
MTPEKATKPHRPGTIHFARLSHSPRLQRLLAYLQAYPGGRTTRQIITGARVMAVNSAADELRAQGFDIPCTFERVTADGSKIYRYRLVST